LPKDVQQAIGKRLAEAGTNPIQKADINKFIDTLPSGSQGQARNFFDGPYKDFVHHLLAHASGQGFFAGAMFGLVAIVAAAVIINVKKSEVPSNPTETLVAA
jgi:hypothetical protein